MAKKISQKDALAAMTIFMSYCIEQCTGTATKTPAGKTAKDKPAGDDLGLDLGDDLNLGDTPTGDDGDLGLGDLGETSTEVTDGFGNNPDPKYAEIKKLMTALSKALGGKTAKAYQILQHFGCENIGALALTDLDKCIKGTQNEIAKAKKAKKK